LKTTIYFDSSSPVVRNLNGKSRAFIAALDLSFNEIRRIGFYSDFIGHPVFKRTIDA
jgi:hypothetical protein